MNLFKKINYLGKLQNCSGDSPLRLSHMRLDNGKVYSSRHQYYLDCFQDLKFMEVVNNRTTLPQEIVVECDNPYLITLSVKLLLRHDIHFCLFKANRGYHAHFWCPNLVLLDRETRKNIKQKIIQFFLGDTQLASENTTIALEWATHWKSGKEKICVRYDKNYRSNNYTRILGGIA